MKHFGSNIQFTTNLHLMMKHKVQGILWDLLAWLDTEEEIQSVRDILSYIRLFTDFGDNTQGRLFLESVKEMKVLRLILPEIASRLVSRGKATGATWLEELGLHIQELHKKDPHPGVGHDRDGDVD